MSQILVGYLILPSTMVAHAHLTYMQPGRGSCLAWPIKILGIRVIMHAPCDEISSHNLIN